VITPVSLWSILCTRYLWQCGGRSVEVGGQTDLFYRSRAIVARSCDATGRIGTGGPWFRPWQ